MRNRMVTQNRLASRVSALTSQGGRTPNLKATEENTISLGPAAAPTGYWQHDLTRTAMQRSGFLKPTDTACGSVATGTVRKRYLLNQRVQTDPPYLWS